MLKLAIRNILRQPLRMGLTLAAIALGVASLVLSGGFVEDILIQLREATIHSQLGHLQIYRSGQYASGGHRPYEFLIDDSTAIERAIDKLPGVAARAHRLSFSGLLNNGRGELPIIGEGIQPEPEARIGSLVSLVHGRHLASTDRYGILIGEGLARAMRVSVGNRINLVLSTREGAMNTLDFDVVGIFRTLSREYDAHVVRIPLEAAQELTSTDGISAVVVLLTDTAGTLDAKSRMVAALPSTFEVITWNELADFYKSTAALYERQFLVLQAVIVMLVLFSVANSVNMTLHERTMEFGTLRALGNTGLDVFKLAILETVLLGFAGAVLGVAIGVAVALIVSAIGISMPPPPNSEAGFTASIRVVPGVLAAALALGWVASIVAALLPARRLARIPIVDALRSGV